VIGVAIVPEPPEFAERARKPGNAWLAANPGAARPRDYWSPFRAALAEGFAQRCGYTAMFEPVGTVDHFVSYREDPTRAYEWPNYRFASQWINSSKRDGEMLDPYLVGEGWFEILLPSLQLVMTDQVPLEHRAVAERTLRKIGRDPRLMKQRRHWYQTYLDGNLSLDGLRRHAPQIAAAEEKRLAACVPRSPEVS
jgi:hypothetical protein